MTTTLIEIAKNCFKNLIKLRYLFLALFLLTISSCSTNSTEPSTVPPTASFTPITITPVLIGKGSLFTTENIVQQNTVINNATNWNNFISPIGQFILQNNFTTTVVNFNNYQLILVVDRGYEYLGKIITITDVTETGTNIVVSVKISGDFLFTPSASQPFHIVQIPKSPKPVIFQ